MHLSANLALFKSWFLSREERQQSLDRSAAGRPYVRLRDLLSAVFGLTFQGLRSYAFREARPMPHLARPTPAIGSNKSAGAHRIEAWPQHNAVSLRLTDLTPIQNDPEAEPQDETVSTTRVSGWDQESMPRRVIDPSAHADGTDLVANDRVAVNDSSRGQSAATPPDHASQRINYPERVKDNVRPLQGRNECVPDHPWATPTAIESQPFRLLIVASPRHMAVSLRLTNQVKSFHHPEAGPQEIGGIASGIFLMSRAGKAEPYRYVLRQSRVELFA